MLPRNLSFFRVPIHLIENLFHRVRLRLRMCVLFSDAILLFENVAADQTISLEFCWVLGLGSELGFFGSMGLDLGLVLGFFGS